MGQLQSVSAELAELGYQIIAISPDRPEKVRYMLEKTAYDYRLFSDTKLKAALALGVAFTVDAKTIERYKGYGIDLEEASGESHLMLPVPTVLVLDTEGTIRFVYSHPNHKVRLNAEELVAAARRVLD